MSASSDGRYFAGLDHLRALAAFLLVLWHFEYRPGVGPMSDAQVPWLAFLDEGHIGVALFMTLSGYLFAKLIGDRPIDYRQFFVNRIMRLAPLLLVMLTLYGLLHYPDDLRSYAADLGRGWIMPNWPNGAWSIVVELQFYTLLPAILAGTRRWPQFPLLLVAGAILLRLALHADGQDVQKLAFFSLVGRFDQFVIGIYVARRPPSVRATIAAVGALYLVYVGFTAAGGFYGSRGSPIWIVLPAIEAIGLAALIAWYDRRPWRGRIMHAIGKSGRYSYGIYLLHGFVVTQASAWVDSIFGLDSLFEVLPFAILFFVWMTVMGAISHRFIEAPFLRRRRSYLGRTRETETGTKARPLPSV